MPLQAIITAEKTVSRASVGLGVSEPSMIDRMSPTSMTVTATASSSGPNGSPVLLAITSA